MSTMLPITPPRKKLKSPGQDSVFNPVSIICTNVPEGLFDAATAKKHFNKFGRVVKIKMVPKRSICVIDYDQPISAERAVLNAGAFDGFMFDVTRTKPKVRRKSKRDDDPDWVPDPELQEELSAMSGGAIYRVPRQKSMEIETPPMKPKNIIRMPRAVPVKKKIAVREKPTAVSQPPSGTESPVVPVQSTSMSTPEAAAELHQLRARVSLTPDEQWRTLDARDRILRSWGGAGARVRAGGATIGTCPDMCPEKELLHRQAEHQVMTLEAGDAEGQLVRARAVKQYSRSSADQEIPMCYELRPPRVLARTCAYLLHEIADTTRQVTLADWFHFMWDRFRSIRKDITQQALCCSESIQLVEMCARFHAHSAARLADLQHSQFDQKLNTDNLTKCLQTLKHMYGDVGPEHKPNEAEFRGYVALLNLGDANFWWEIKQLPLDIQKSAPIAFAMQVFNALDNNNYVRFFRLVRRRASYLQACVLLRYFNDVRARALARIVKAYAPRGGSRFPARDVMDALAFESVENMKSFINHYGLRFAKSDEYELSVILDRNQFIEDSDPYPTSRAVDLIESKRQCSVGQVIAGGPLPGGGYFDRAPYSSFGEDGRLKETALVAGDQGYDTTNDTNKDVRALAAEIQRLARGGRSFDAEKTTPKANAFVKPDAKTMSPKPNPFLALGDSANASPKLFSFKPAITVAPKEIIDNSPEKMFSPDAKNAFSFSKPQEPPASHVFSGKMYTGPPNVFTQKPDNPFTTKSVVDTQNVFSKPIDTKTPFAQKIQSGAADNVFANKSVFGQHDASTKQADTVKNIFGNVQNRNIFEKKEDDQSSQQNVFAKSVFTGSKTDNLFTKPDSTVKFENAGNIFAKAVPAKENTDTPSIFSSFNRQNPPTGQNKSLFVPNGESSLNKLSPSSIFKNADSKFNGTDSQNGSIFQNKLKAQSVADSILNSVSKTDSVFEFDEEEANKQLELRRYNEEKRIEEQRKQQEKLKQEEERIRERKRLEELRLKEEARRKQEELKLLEENRKREEERKKEEIRKKLEEERKTELKRQAEEKRFKEKVEKESTELVEELINEVNCETTKESINEEQLKLSCLIQYAEKTTSEILIELCNEICCSEMMAEKFWTDKVMKKWFHVWRRQYMRNCNRRRVLEDTPVWLTDRTPSEEAAHLRRYVETNALQNMNAIHRGYQFVGELRLPPPPDAYNVMEIIRSSLLKRMKQICYPYDKCFFWKVTLVSPGQNKWLCRKINIEKWLTDSFSDKKRHDESESLIQVGKQSWNNLMDFAISVSLTSKENDYKSAQAIDGSNGVLFYDVDNHQHLIKTIEETLKHKYPYQVIPIAVILPKQDKISSIEILLNSYMNKKAISAFKIFFVDPANISESLNATTKAALKWLAKKYPPMPPLETDYLKSMCQRYLGNEIWSLFRTERDNRMNTVIKDMPKLVQCYNIAVDKLTEVITNEEHFNYPSFPLEFNVYLNSSSPYPKPYEYIPSNVKTTENVSAIKDIMKKLKLPNPSAQFKPMSIVCMQQQIRSYCNQIGWFEDPEEVVCKVVALLPNELMDTTLPCEDFTKNFAHYDLIDFLNIIVYEQISRLNNFDNRFAIYEKSILDEYRHTNWLYETSVLSEIKHTAIEYEDEIDYYIDAKRRKIALDSMEYLMLEDKDCSMVEECIKETDDSITKYSSCTDAVKQLEKELDEGKKKSIEFENLLRAALSDV